MSERERYYNQLAEQAREDDERDLRELDRLRAALARQRGVLERLATASRDILDAMGWAWDGPLHDEFRAALAAAHEELERSKP